MKRSIVFVLLMLSISFPAFAQDSTPTPEETPVVTETVAPEPTVVVEPTAPPTEPEPSPVDESAIPEQVWVLLGTAILGIVVVAFAGIVAAYKGLPAPVQAIVLSILKTVVVEFDKKAKETENKVDDVISDEFKKRIAQLEASLTANGLPVPPPASS